MASTAGSTRQDIAEIAALIGSHRVQDATDRLLQLIRGVDGEALILISPDIRSLIARLLPKRRRQLTEALETALARPVRPNVALAVPKGVALEARSSAEPRVELYRSMLLELRNHHIFQWATFYRDTLGFIYKDLRERLPGYADQRGSLRDALEALERHARDIFQSGHEYLMDNGLSPEVSRTKSLNGLSRFLYLVIDLYLDGRDRCQHAKEARLLRDITSSMLVGVLRGYGQVKFSEQQGWDILSKNVRSWVPTLGFVTGTDALSLMHDFPSGSDIEGVTSTVVPTLLAAEQVGNKYQGSTFILPRLSRVAVGDPPRLDVTFVSSLRAASRDVMLSCFFGGPVHDKRAIEDAVALRATAVVAKMSPPLKKWADARDDARVIDATDLSSVASDHLQNFAELVRARIEAQVAAAPADGTAIITRNFASEFPLEDPEIRRFFLVERHSVKKLLEQFEQGTGIHLWCSVRRSGKTTAVANLADMTGRSTVIVQTMDQQPHQPEMNVLERAVTKAFEVGKAIGPDFFQSVVDESLRSSVSIQAEKRKIVFVIDEYETLFGLIAAYTKEQPDLRFLVGQPLLSQMVGFGTRNLLILLGQRPDAHYILASQNQLSPLVKQHNFPLFEHHSRGAETEYAQFLRRVLSEKLPFTPSFVDAVYSETSGHPYLTVNLLVDLCDWLIENNSVEGETELDDALFQAFAQGRLSQAALQRSPYYTFFQRMIAEFMSELARRQEPWLHAIAHVLHQIARAHPKAFASPINSYQRIAEPFGPIVRLTPDQLLISACKSNFLAVDGGQVRPAIRLLGRLAACVVPEVN